MTLAERLSRLSYIRYRRSQGDTLDEIGLALGISRARVQQIASRNGVKPTRKEFTQRTRRRHKLREKLLAIALVPHPDAAAITAAKQAFWRQQA